MAPFAVIESNVIINLIQADSLEDAESITEKQCIEYTIPFDYYTTSPQIGWELVDGQIVNPVNPPPLPDESEEETPE
jgi:hypothetical protein